MTQYVLTGRPGGEPGLPYPFSLITDQMGVGSIQNFTLGAQDEATLIAAGIVQPVSSEVTGFATLDANGRLTGGQVPVSVATVSSPGGAAATTPTVWLDSYYDAAVFANKSAAIQAAYVAAAAQRAVLECQAYRVYSLDTAPLKLNPSTPITIEGHKSTLQANWGKPRVIDFTRTADDQTWNDIDIRDWIFDANSLTAASAQSVVGNLIDGGGANQQRVNATRIYLRRCQWKNVPYDVTGGGGRYACFSLVSLHGTAGQAQTNLTDIRLEQAKMTGGNYGVVVEGQCSLAATAVEVFHDKLYMDVEHDTGVTPAGSAFGANVALGGVGFGDYCEVRLIGANSTDVGLEIDGMQRPEVWGRVTDAWNTEYLVRNFHAPPHLASQVATFHSCQARVINLNPDPASSVSAGWTLNGTGGASSAYGHVILENCSYYSKATNFTQAGQAILLNTGSIVSKLTIVGTFDVTLDNINSQPGSSQRPSLIRLYPGGTAFTFAVKGQVSVSTVGTGGTNIVAARYIEISPQTGCKTRIDIDDISISPGLAGMPVGATRGLVLGISGTAGGSIRGRIKRLGWGTFTDGDTTPQLFVPAASTVFTIDGRLIIEELDYRNDPVASPAIYGAGGGTDATNKAAMPIRTKNQTTYPIPSSAMSATFFATTNFTTATANQYLGGLPAELVFTPATGAGVTAIDASKDGTTYENFLTQAAAAIPAEAVVVPIENGDFVKVTFTTTQPTARIRFRRAQ